MEAEGVIKFSMEHRATPLSARRFEALCVELSAWREVLARLGLVGQDPNRYEGAGFGNMSARVGPFPGEPGRRPFVITGTQTGALPRLGLEHYCLVESYDLARNRVQSQGATAPSSESMTHGAIYDLSPHIRYVFHAHSPTLWGAAEALRLPQTGAGVAYGTVEMARAARELYRATSLSERQIFSMRGHEDGIVVFGRTAQEAGSALIAELARALCLGR